jgi:glycosyltransferase involved in cell wall biosynthesis
MRMKVLIVTDSYPNEQNPFSSIFVHNQVKALLAEGIDTAVLLYDMRSARRKRKWGFSEYVCDGVRVFRYALPCGPIPYVTEALSVLAAKKGLKKAIKRFGRPDILHAHFALSGYCAYKIKNMYGIPYIITEHNSGLINGIEKRLESISETAYANSSSLIAVGTILAEKMKRYTDREVKVVPNIIPSGFAYAPKGKLGKFTYISVANLIERKRIDLVIRAFSEIHQQDNDTRLMIVGDGPMLDELRKLCKELHMENAVEFTGVISNKNLPEIYNKCHCFVLPSQAETFGVVYAEAAACGLPVIATDCGGPTDIVNRENGIIIKKDSLADLTEAMKHMKNNFREYNAQNISDDITRRFGEVSIAQKLIYIYSGVINEIESC